MLLKKIGTKLPVIEPVMKLTPTIKLIGKAILSFLNKLTFLFIELFCIPIINNKNKQELKVTEKINFLEALKILLETISFLTLDEFLTRFSRNKSYFKI